MTNEPKKAEGVESNIPEHYKKSDFYYWNGYYYKQQRCEVVEEVIHGNIIDHQGDRCSSVDIHDTGYIIGKSIGGAIKLKIIK